jgi:RNA-directed DNA polymerase
MVETEARPGATPTIEDWAQAPWRKLEHHVYRLQKRIYKAQNRGNTKTVHSLQRLVMKSQAARMLAVRRVAQDNQGKKTAGVDGIKAIGPLVRLLIVERLCTPNAIKAQPVRRVMIPKPGKDEKRPLGIPVMLDRAHQALAKLALEPQWEARFEPNSYGFRPGRSGHDAIEAIFKMISTKTKYVLDADIKGCFDNINHQALLAKLDTTPALRRTIKSWLTAGVLSNGAFVPTSSGTPQGGVISPLLANIALHGLEETVNTSYGRRTNRHWVRPTLVRYADDFVILCADREGITAAATATEHWLANLGLQLNPTKTRVTHTYHMLEGNVGFDFLGFTIRQFPQGKRHTGKTQQGEPLGFKTIIRPSKQAVKAHIARTGTIIRKYQGAPQLALITTLNPIVRGWARYFRTGSAAATFKSCDHHIYTQLRRWANRRHPKKGKTWIVKRYWSMRPGNKWTFMVKEGKPKGIALTDHTMTPIKRHVKVRGNASPYDGNLPYWAMRLKTHPLTRSTLGKLLTIQEGKCPHCGLTLTLEDHIDIDHILAKEDNGHDGINNKQALHNHCHDEKTTQDNNRRNRMTAVSNGTRELFRDGGCP